MAEVRRIAAFGTESTGKTALARRLAEHFGELWSPEFVREFWDLRDGKITVDDLGTIALGQIANEDLALSRAQRVVFFDTNLLTNVMWNDLLFPGECPPWVREEAERRAREISLYLLCDTDLPFEPDPQRCFPDVADREKCRRLCREMLESRGLAFAEVCGAGEARVALAIAKVTEVLKP